MPKNYSNTKIFELVTLVLENQELERTEREEQRQHNRIMWETLFGTKEPEIKIGIVQQVRKHERAFSRGVFLGSVLIFIIGLIGFNNLDAVLQFFK